MYQANKELLQSKEVVELERTRETNVVILYKTFYYRSFHSFLLDIYLFIYSLKATHLPTSSAN